MLPFGEIIATLQVISIVLVRSEIAALETTCCSVGLTLACGLELLSWLLVRSTRAECDVAFGIDGIYGTIGIDWLCVHF